MKSEKDKSIKHIIIKHKTVKHQTIEQIEEEKAKKNKELLKRLKYEDLKRGITKKKEDYEEAKARRYVRKINQYYEIFKPDKHLEITKGTKREGKHTYPAKSQRDWDNDNAARYIYVKKNKISKKTGNRYQVVYKYRLNIETTNPELLYIKQSLEEEQFYKKPYIQPRKEKVLLIIDNFMYYKELKIEPSEICFNTEIKINNRKTPIYLEKYYPEETDEFNTVYGKMTGKEILKTILGTKVKMYKGYINEYIVERIIN